MSTTQAIMSLLNTTAGAELPNNNNTLPGLLQPLLSLLIPSSVMPLLATVLSTPALRDWLKLIVLGGVFEFFRRTGSAGWDGFLDTFFVHARVEQDDDAFEWLMLYLSKLPAFNRSRKICVSTKQKGDAEFGDCTCHDCLSKRPRKDDLLKRLAYYPGYDAPFSFFFGLSRITAERSKQALNIQEGLQMTEGLTLRILNFGLGGSRSVITRLVTAAKDLFDKQEEHRISVWFSDQYGQWRRAGSKLRRPWSSIVLDDGIKERLLADAMDFAKSQSWYVERGIPYRRGYLLHGVPGSGKTSLIQAIASELELDVYVVPLSKKSMDDQGLNDAITSLPPRCIALMEDIDCTFKKGITARAVYDDSDDAGKDDKKDGDEGTSPFGITLSGLLNAIDGVAAHEGRLLFATTNAIDALDPALIRPGRMDLSIEFKNATQRQAAQLFKCFFRDEDIDDSVAESEVQAPVLEKPSLGPSPKSVPLPTPPGTPSTASPPPPSLPALLSLATSPHDFIGERLMRAERDELAVRFAAAIPEREFSMASLQGYLMQHKLSPRACAEEVEAWVVEERVRNLEGKRKKEEEERKALERKARRAEQEKEKSKTEDGAAKEKSGKLEEQRVDS